MFPRVRWRSVSYPGVTCVEEQAEIFYDPLFWRALGQSAQAEQDTFVLYASRHIKNENLIGRETAAKKPEW